MGVLVPVGEGQARIRWKVVGQPRLMETTLGIRDLEDEPFSGSPDILAEQVGDSLIDATIGVATQISNQFTLVGVEVMIMTADGPLTGEYPMNIVGTATFQPPPINTAWIWRKNTATGGRRNRGRMYWPCARLGETAIDAAGTITPANVSAEQDDANAFRLALGGNGLKPVLQHSDGGPSTVVTSFAVENIVATQRRRMR